MLRSRFCARVKLGGGKRISESGCHDLPNNGKHAAFLDQDLYPVIP